MKEYDSEAETRKHIATVSKLISKVIASLLDKQIFHDSSKLEEPEKSVFDEYTPKLKNSTYGSEEYKQFLKGMGVALEHHYKVNRHHPEHYKLKKCVMCQGIFKSEECLLPPNDSENRFCPECGGGSIIYECSVEGYIGLDGMSLMDIIEMLCDWQAATLRHADGDILKSIEINQKRFKYSDEMKQILLNTIGDLEL